MTVLSAGKPASASLQRRAMDLMELARDPSVAARKELIAELYRLCGASAELTADERELAVSLVLEIIKGAELEVRQRLAEQLAIDPKAPRALVLALAWDEIAVAFSVLIESEVLTEADLIKIIQERPLEHKLGAAQRRVISEPVSTAFVDSGDPQVMRWLVENPGAKIPHAAMEIIVKTSSGEAALQRPLVRRHDLPADLAGRMLAWVTGDLRERLIRAGDVAEIVPEPVPDVIAAAEARALAVALRLRSAGKLTVDLLGRTLRAGKALEFDALLARFCRISLTAARELQASPTGEMLAVALKAQGIDKGSFATLFMLCRKVRDPKHISPSVLARAVTVFDALTPGDAASRLATLQAIYPETPPP
ncbi:MAG: hypothetical protein JWL84_5092 [Rhodospirillales bacterium]|nr:hypothetical protein [Rhodospirillales bacterium]